MQVYNKVKLQMDLSNILFFLKVLKNKKEKLSFILLLIILGGCSLGKRPLNTILYDRLTITPAPICRTETYKDIIECLLKYRQSLELSNQDKEEIINKLKGE